MYALGTVGKSSSMVALLAFTLSSCAFLNQEVAESRPPEAAKAIRHVAVTKPSSSKTYGFAAKTPVVPVEQKGWNDKVVLTAPRVAVSDTGSTPYVCSPSGFGRKSQCFQQ